MGHRHFFRLWFYSTGGDCWLFRCECNKRCMLGRSEWKVLEPLW